MGIRCTGCAYDNDPTRVYCHNCGARLERSGEPPPPSGFNHPSDMQKLKRPRAPLPWGKYFFFFAKLLFLTALAAGLVAAFLPPRDLPPPVASDENLATRLSALISSASSGGAAVAFAVPAADVNRWLVTVAKFAPADGLIPMDARRVYAVQGNGTIRVGVETALFGKVDLYFEGDYAPVPGAAGYLLQPVRYSVGRLPLPVALGWPVQRQLAGLGEALAVPLSELAKASFIEVSPERLTLRWAGREVQ
jgi:hypothetical protein